MNNLKKHNGNDGLYSIFMLLGYSSFHLFYILTANDINNSLKKIANKNN